MNVLLESAIRSLVIAACVGVALEVLRPRDGRRRHVAWTLVVLAMLGMPALQRVVPRLGPSFVSVSTTGVLPSVDASVASPPAPPAAMGTAAASGAGRSVTRAPVPPAAAPAEVASPVRTSTVVTLGYLTIAAILLLRLLVSLVGVGRLRRSSREITASPFLPGERVFESLNVMTPVTVGLLRPAIILPNGWTSWPAATLRAVLAHERAHVRRRDGLVRFISHVNRAVFWWHPLAWWLERAIVSTAEQACDDEVVQAIGQPREYASVLVDMAATVREAGGRAPAFGFGVAGDGHFTKRIDRILGGAIPRAGRRQTFALAGLCAGLVALVAACGRPAPVAPLKENPRIAASRERQNAQYRTQREAEEAARSLTADQAAQLEADWRKAPEDLQKLETLLVFYRPDFSGRPVPDAAARIAARRQLILWLIEHHPENDLARSINARIFIEPSEWLRDPDGYAAAKALWLRQSDRLDASAAVLGNAATFLDVSDKPIAERLLLRAQAKDARGEWTARLGALYGQILVGSSSFTLNNVVRSVDVTAAQSAYAQGIRAKLGSSRDPKLLASVAYYLIVNAAQARPDFDHLSLGRSYAQQALTLDAENRTAQYAIETADRRNDPVRRAPLFKDVPRPEWPRVVASLPDTERLRVLTRFANDEYMMAEDHDWRVTHPESLDRDPAANREQARLAWQRSKDYAQEALTLAARMPDDVYTPDALLQANAALGVNALRQGDRAAALRYLDAASRTPKSRIDSVVPTSYNDGSLEPRLIKYLLDAGERDSVITYFERAAQTRGAGYTQAAADVRHGFYPTYAPGMTP
jgi:beta-lactamase regulating signal transducer with metallopeptidase domain